MGGLKKAVKKGMVLGEMAFAQGGGVVNWFPGHMAVATRAIRDRLKVADLVVEVRDSRIPLSSVNRDLQSHISQKKRIIALNKTDLANPNITQKWVRYFDSCKQDSIPINAHSKGSVCKLLELVELKLKERISREPTLLVMVVGVPNVGKSALINSIHQIASKRFPASQKMKRARVGPLPGVTQDIAGFKIANKPSIYVLDTPGVLIPSIPDIETGLKLALSGSVKDSVVGEERLAQYLLAILNTRNTPLHWKPLIESKTEEGQYNLENSHECNLEDLQPRKLKPLNLTDGRSVEDRVTEVQRALYSTLSEFNGNYMEEENELEVLIEEQFKALQKALRIPHKASDARLVVSKKFISLFRMGKLGPIVLDDVPVPDDES